MRVDGFNHFYPPAPLNRSFPFKLSISYYVSLILTSTDCDGIIIVMCTVYDAKALDSLGLDSLGKNLRIINSIVTSSSPLRHAITQICEYAQYTPIYARTCAYIGVYACIYTGICV